MSLHNQFLPISTGNFYGSNRPKTIYTPYTQNRTLPVTVARGVLIDQLTFSIKVVEGWGYANEKEEPRRVSLDESMSSDLVSVFAFQTCYQHCLTCQIFPQADHPCLPPLSLAPIHHWAPWNTLWQTVGHEEEDIWDHSDLKAEQKSNGGEVWGAGTGNCVPRATKKAAVVIWKRKLNFLFCSRRNS